MKLSTESIISIAIMALPVMLFIPLFTQPVDWEKRILAVGAYLLGFAFFVYYTIDYDRS